MGVQYALAKKQLCYKRARPWGLVATILIPAMALGLMGIAKVYFVTIDSEAFNFDDTKFDNCPAFSYGAEFEDFLPQDHFESFKTWSNTNYPGTYLGWQNLYLLPNGPEFDEELYIENYPEGVTERVCRPEIVRFFHAKKRKTGAGEALERLKLDLQKGWQTLDISVSYTVVGEESRPKEVPQLVTFLESFGGAWKADLSGHSSDLCKVLEVDGEAIDPDGPNSCYDLFNGRYSEILAATLMGHESEECFDTAEARKKGYGYCSVSNWTKPGEIRIPYMKPEDVSGPYVTDPFSSAFLLPYKTDTENNTGTSSSGDNFESELYNFTFNGSDLSLRPKVRSMLDFDMVLGGTQPVIGWYNKPYPDNSKCPWYTNYSVVDDPHHLMDINPILTLYDQDRRIAAEQGLNYPWSGELAPVAGLYPSGDWGFIKILSQWFQRWARFTRSYEDNAVPYQFWHGDGKLYFKNKVTPEEYSVRIKHLNTLYVAPFCYARNSPDLYLSQKAKYLWDVMNWYWAVFDDDRNVKDMLSVLSSYTGITDEGTYAKSHLKSFTAALGAARLQRRINLDDNYCNSLKEFWCTEDVDCDECPERWEDDDYTAWRGGYFWRGFADKETSFWENTSGEVMVTDIYGKNHLVQTPCDPQRMSDLQSNMDGFIHYFDVQIVFEAIDMLGTYAHDEGYSLLDVKQESSPKANDRIVVKEAFYPTPSMSRNLIR